MNRLDSQLTTWYGGYAFSEGTCAKCKVEDVVLVHINTIWQCEGCTSQMYWTIPTRWQGMQRAFGAAREHYRWHWQALDAWVTNNIQGVWRTKA